MEKARRLIEVDLPIGRISENARKEQNIKKGHIHRLHVWWATRPLAACRAVTLGAILPDPANENCPEEFRRKAQETLSWRAMKDLSDPYALRKALLDFIADFSSWESSANQRMINTAQALVVAAYPESLSLVLDPLS